jgi:hypothetical protein
VFFPLNYGGLRVDIEELRKMDVEDIDRLLKKLLNQKNHEKKLIEEAKTNSGNQNFNNIPQL